MRIETKLHKVRIHCREHMVKFAGAVAQFHIKIVVRQSHPEFAEPGPK